MSPEAQITARFRARIKKDLPMVRAKVRLRYDRGIPSIVAEIEPVECVDAVCELATIYADDLFSICVNGRCVHPDDENDHSHMFEE
jgi:hypothetical protein